MKRDLAKLKAERFDILIIGGGIYGVCIAWDAALRGLSVALVEKSDFGSATSSNSLKIIHGGLRYLQHADFKRMRESITERTNLMRIAPHLVHPLRCIMPTYGHSVRGKEVMAVALFLNDLIGFDRNKLRDPQKRLPAGKVISRSQCLEVIPGLNDENLTGAAIWYDCQLYNSERMLLSILHSAVHAGACVANYVESTGFIHDGKRVSGIDAKDQLTGEQFKIYSRLVVNCAGPWFKEVLNSFNGHIAKPRIQLSAAMNLVVKKKLFDEYAVGIWSQSKFKDDDALISKGSRLFFITPWRNCSLIGTTHVPFNGEPGKFRISENDIEEFLNEVNMAYPPANLRREDVVFFYGGMLPAEENQQSGTDVRLLKNYRIIDHSQESGLEGIVSIVGVKYTTARDVAEKTIDCAFNKLDKPLVKSLTTRTPVCGGDIDNFEDFVKQAISKAKHDLNENTIRHLVMNYGTKYPEILYFIEEDETFAQPIMPGCEVLKAEVVHAVRKEMAVKLVDVVRRRIELGAAGYPGDQAVETCANLVAKELGWDVAKRRSEIEATKLLYIATA